jgi:hypothetical protein
MVQGLESCKTLLTPKVELLGSQGTLLSPIFWDQRPTMIGCPYGLWPTHDNLFKNNVNPTFNYIVCPTWVVGKVPYLVPDGPC